MDDDDLTWITTLDPTLIAVLGGGLLLLLLMALLAGWLVVRQVRRSELAARGRQLTARGRELGVQGATAVAARRLPPGDRRTAAELQLQVQRTRAELRRQVAGAVAAGAHLGEVPALLPALDAESARIEQRLRQQTLAPSPGCADVLAEARGHLELLADVADAVRQAERVQPAAGRLPADVADAVSALRAHTDAFRELTSPGLPTLPPAPPPGR
ncbi:hypothetical protein [Blastococcus sp. TF02A-26]|uniref:hypothetical protein n=1 Tax=Blastococcus sp. TF02A-26 TaxID=2250577 RepID=UPI000DE979E8|nr:hypothetical protein [Blastococcus sp. TF02A-26]RBY85987.1 hypothetical protein DQ240_11500 [Blastococcus sp. TF02A-26]